MNDKPRKTAQDFTALVDAVRRVHDECAAAVNRTVNTTLTLRNWLIGSYIRDYEQNGADRAQYGIHLLEKLSDSLQGCLDRCYTGRYLGLCRQLFDAYPSIRKSVISEFGADSWTLVQRLSFTHLVELLALEDPLKRAFYEIECIRGNWSVRALKRQIATLYYERSGLSMDKEKLADMAHSDRPSYYYPVHPVHPCQFPCLKIGNEHGYKGWTG